MFFIVLTVHIVLCLTLIVLVLLQQGKGADMGAAFGGGGSNTLFGASGATAFITRLTTGVAVCFMVTSILLVNLYSSYTTSPGVVVNAGPDKIQDLLESSKAAAPAPAEGGAPVGGAPAQAPAPAAPVPAQDAAAPK